jgi:hypothetical protein
METSNLEAFLDSEGDEMSSYEPRGRQRTEVGCAHTCAEAPFHSIPIPHARSLSLSINHSTSIPPYSFNTCLCDKNYYHYFSSILFNRNTMTSIYVA